MSDDFGFTNEGFVNRTFTQWRDALQQALTAKIGIKYFDETQSLGSLTSIIALLLAETSEQLATSVEASSLNTSWGFSLDGIAAQIGIKRLDATYTTVIAGFVGSNKTYIPSGSRVKMSSTGNELVLKDNVYLTYLNCHAITVSTIDKVAVANYILTINGTEISTPAGDIGTITDDIVAQIQTNLGDKLNVIKNDNSIYIELKEDTNNLTVTSNATFSVDSVTVLSQVTMADIGTIPVTVGSIDTIMTPCSGWTGVYNQYSGKLGRNVETDTELRVRIAKSFNKVGSATGAAILATVLNVEGVSSARIDINYTNEPTPTLNPHSFMLLVNGGDNDAIAKAIQSVRPIGIESMGDVTVNVLDQFNVSHAVRFSRPTKIYIFIEVELTSIQGQIEPDASTKISQNLVKQINALDVGESISYQSLFSSVYYLGNDTGIKDATINIGSTDNPDNRPALSPQNIILRLSDEAYIEEQYIKVTIT